MGNLLLFSTFAVSRQKIQDKYGCWHILFWKCGLSGDRLATESYNSPDHHNPQNVHTLPHCHTAIRPSHSGIITLCALLGNIFKIIYVNSHTYLGFFDDLLQKHYITIEFDGLLQNTQKKSCNTKILQLIFIKIRFPYSHFHV